MHRRPRRRDVARRRCTRGKAVDRDARRAGDELIVHPCDMNACNFGRTTIFRFIRHRRIKP